jgi:hypothetical protein
LIFLRPRDGSEMKLKTFKTVDDTYS